MMASTNPELTHGRRASTDLPRLLQIEVGRLPAHLCGDQVGLTRGGDADSVDVLLRRRGHFASRLGGL